MNHQSISVLDQHHVLLNTLEAGYDLETDWPESVREMRIILDSHPEPLFIVDDIRRLHLTVDELILAASLVGRGDSPLYRHPKSLGIYFISESKAVQMAAAGMHSQAFDNMNVKVFHNLEMVLDYIERTLVH